MTTKNASSHTKTTASNHHAATEDTMTKKMTATHAHAHAHAHVAKTEEASLPMPAAGATPAPSALSPTTGVALVFLNPPPAGANIPVPPPGAASPPGSNYRQVLPKATEHAALPGAVADLKRFTNFNDVFALTGLPYAQVVQAFDIGSQWTAMRTATTAWDVYCLIQEGIAWMTIRAMMEKLRPVFEMACAANPTLATMYPNLTTLLGARKAISAKATATKRANKAAIARGEAPTHGAVGKKRQKAANKAIVAAAKAATPTPPATVASAAPPAAPAAPAPLTTANGAAGTNGAAH